MYKKISLAPPLALVLPLVMAAHHVALAGFTFYQSAEMSGTWWYRLVMLFHLFPSTDHDIDLLYHKYAATLHHKKISTGNLVGLT
eukprot:scaffold122904_cov62-Attheya_sp.AAC.3